MSEENQLQQLLQKLSDGTATEEEVRLLREMITEDEEGRLAGEANIFFSGRADVFDDDSIQAIHPPFFWRNTLQSIIKMDKIPPKPKKHLLRRYWPAAAVLLLAVATGAYWLLGRPQPLKPVVTHTADIAPGHDGAVLTLSDGTRVTLDSMGNGLVARQSGTQVSLRNGQLSYDPAGPVTGPVAYNTMTTPKGRQFSLVLPDGTRAWLNAASNIRFPTAFTEKERKVQVSGEVYFEVAHNAAQPFIVELIHENRIEVLGTHFNVQAYPDDNALRTTLLEGSIVTGGYTLQPGQQLEVALKGTFPILHKKADTDKVMAWKNGLFNFNGATLRQVMRQLERWYDIEVVYETGVRNITFGGKMTRGVSLQGVLIALEKSGVHFKLEGRKLIVKP